jgi:hypothetical protein
MRYVLWVISSLIVVTALCGLSLSSSIENEIVATYEDQTDRITAQTQTLQAMMASVPSEDVIQTYIGAGKQSRQLRSLANRGAVVLLLLSISIGVTIPSAKIIYTFLSGRVKRATEERDEVVDKFQQFQSNQSAPPRYTRPFEKQPTVQRARPF